MDDNQKSPFESLAALDRLIHEPARLAIMTALSACEHTDFLYLQRLTGLTKGNLSSHLAKLEEAGLIWVVKQLVGKTLQTLIGLSDTGRWGIEQHWQRLENLRKSTQAWQAENQDAGVRGKAAGNQPLPEVI